MEPLRDTELTQLDAAHRRPLPANAVKGKYSYTGLSVDSEESDLTPLKPEEHHHLHNSHWESERPPWFKTVAIQTFAFLWLVPVGALLYLNIVKHIIGASAWCPFGHCLPSVYDPRASDGDLTPYELPAKFDRDTHDLLGALQLVAKALEVWFIVIAGWLVYIVTTILAGRREGIPIGYFNRPTEFAEVTSLFDPLLWTTLRRLPSTRGRTRVGRKRVYLFVVATIFLCFICNLMGPAVAVLVIPSLQWIETKKVGDQAFTTTGSVEPPGAYGYLFADSQCYTPDSTNSTKDATDKANAIANFDAKAYSCAFSWSQVMDAWVDSYYAVAPQGSTAVVISVQNLTSFTYNLTASHVGTEKAPDGNRLVEPVFWAPSRQILNMLSNDMAMVVDISAGYNQSTLDTQYGLSESEFDSFAVCNNTVQTFLHRNGPIHGGLVNAWLGFDNETHWTTMVDDEKWLHCYANYNPGNTPLVWGESDMTGVTLVSGNFTKCISVGTGWDDGYKSANFSISGLYSTRLRDYQPDLNVTIHSSGKAAFLKDGHVPTGVDAACLIQNGRVPAEAHCDWDAFWQTGDDASIRQRSKAITTIEMLSSNNTLYNTSGAYGRNDYPYNTTLVMDFVTFEGFADYMLDPSVLTNPLYTTDYTLNLSKTATLDDVKAVPLDPAWLLAAWTANAGERMLSSDTMARTALLNAFELFLSDASYLEPDPAILESIKINAVGLMPIIQTLSMIDFNTTTVSPSAPKDPQRPKLERYARIQVYAYGISSRTGWLGVMVASIGCVVVLLEVVLGFVDRRRFRSPTQLLVAALEHQYNDEFRGVHDERTISRVPFRLQHDSRIAGRFKFEKVG